MIGASHNALRPGRTETPGRGAATPVALARKNAAIFVKAPDRCPERDGADATSPAASLITLGAGNG